MIILPNMKSSIYKKREIASKILVGGNFNLYKNTTEAYNIIRLNLNGANDTTFSAGYQFFSTPVNAIAIQSDGKILVGGGNENGGFLYRLNSNGTYDNSYYYYLYYIVNTIAVQSNGNIIVGGTDASNPTYGFIIYLDPNSDGYPYLDDYYGLPVKIITIQSDGKILVGGGGDDINTSGAFLYRLDSNSINFDGSFSNNTFFQKAINKIQIQPDGKIVIGCGSSSGYPGFLRRLNSDGTYDTSLAVNTYGPIYTVALQSDGKILIGGDFYYSGGGAFIYNIARFNSNGTYDTSFNMGYGFDNGPVNTIAVQSDGKILVGGLFSSYSFNGTYVNDKFCIIRLNSDGTYDTSFNMGYGFSAGMNGTSVNTIVIS